MKKVIMGGLLLVSVILNVFTFWILPKQTIQLKAENLTIIESPKQDASMEHEAFIVEEYVPVLPEGTNIAPAGSVASNGITGAFAEQNVIDGDSGGASYWEGAAGAYPNELSISFAEVHTIHAIRLTLNPDSIWGKRTQTFSVIITDANGDEQTLCPEQGYIFDPASGNEVIIECEDTEVTAVKFVFTANTGASAGQVAELEIYE